MFFTILILSTLTACNVSYTEDWKASKDVVSTDGILQLTVPESYAEVGNLSDVANLQVMNKKDYKFTMVIAESKSDIDDSFTLNDYYESVSQLMAGNIESAELSDAESVTIGDYDALQFTISGMSTNVKIKFLVTLVETDLGFYQIISWTMQYMYYDYEATFKKIAESFTEL